MEFKSLHEIKNVDDATGEFTGYLAVFGDVDSDSDVIVKGAFKVSLASGRTIPVLWQHIQAEPIGVWTDLKEDSHGLLATGKLAIDTELGQRAYSLLKMHAISGLSIGYKPVQFDRVKGVRYLKEVKLFEGSIVTFPANTEATVTAVKGKAMNTFKEAMAAHELRKDLSNQKWLVEDAKDDATDSIMCDASMDKESKKKASRKVLHDAADAHADIMDQRIDAMEDAVPDADSKHAGLTVEVKAARKTMDAVIAAHMKGEQLAAKSMDCMHAAMACHTKGINMARQLSYAGITANDDKSPQAAGAKAAQEALERKQAEDAAAADMAGLLDSLKTTRTRIVA